MVVVPALPGINGLQEPGDVLAKFHMAIAKDSILAQVVTWGQFREQVGAEQANLASRTFSCQTGSQRH